MDKFNIIIRFLAIVGFFGMVSLFMGSLTMDDMTAIIQIALYLSITIIAVEYLAKKFYTK